VDPGETLVLAERRAGLSRSMLNGHGGVESRLLGYDEEGSDRGSRRRPGGQPLVDILLSAGGSGSLVRPDFGQSFSVRRGAAR
jgi:hypothetical protein